MLSPARDQRARDLLEDVQLRDDDRTEDLRLTKENGPGTGCHRPEANVPHPT